MSTGILIAALGLFVQTAQTPAPPPPPPGPIVHGYVYFGPGSAVPIRPSGIDPIEYLGPQVPANTFVYVRGQTDTLGSDEANERLSRRRAIAVADLLVRQGVSPDRISIMACGERVLNRPTADEVSEPLNRFALFDWSPQPTRSSSGCPVEPYRRQDGSR